LQKEIAAENYVEYAPGLNTRKTWELYERARKLMPGGASSHGQCYPIFDPYPLAFERGKGSHVWDIDGNEYVDFIFAMGPLIHGHCHPSIMNAAAEQLAKGTMFALLHEREVDLAEKVHQMVPNADMVRFSSSGAEATSNAIRIARGYTGKNKIIKFEGAYHGSHDYVLTAGLGAPALGPVISPSKVPASWGIPEEVLDTVIVLPWNDLDVVEKTLKRRGHEIAAIITEPILMNIGCVPPKDGYLKGLEQLCEQYDVVFIMDEVISGFRLARGGAQEYYGVHADLATFAKALGAGFPISAITGKRKIMEQVVPGKIMHSGTYNANALCVAAAYASLTELDRDGGRAFKHLTHVGNLLAEGLQRAVDKAHSEAIVQGMGGAGCQLYFTKLEKIANYRDFFSCDSAKYLKFSKGLLKRGVYFHSQQYEHLFVSTVTSEEDVDFAVKAAEDTLRSIS
jgi:glutamate-1-semialdehyde 2,1-aminomutase